MVRGSLTLSRRPAVPLESLLRLKSRVNGLPRRRQPPENVQKTLQTTPQSYKTGQNTSILGPRARERLKSMVNAAR